MSKMEIGNIYPFEFLKYLQPTVYFHRKRLDGTSVYPMVSQIPEEVISLIETGSQYKEAKAAEYDLSWQALKKGYISDGPTYSEFEKLPLSDNYSFIRRNFHKAWVVYVLLFRLLSLHNPIAELKAFFRSRNVRRLDLSKTQIGQRDWETFKSQLLDDGPLVSVVIPTLNRYECLGDILKDLQAQDYPNFELIVVDQSEPFRTDFYKEFKLDINLVRQEEKALWLARNNAVKVAKGHFIGFLDDDSRIESNWISNHLKCLEFFKADISAGVFFPSGSEIPKNSSFFSLSLQFPTNNVITQKAVFKKVGLFDRQFEKQRMGDGEFGMRAYLNGFKSISNPFAFCVDVKAESGGLREMGSWDAFRPSNLLAPRPIPSVTYYFRRYFGNKAAKLALMRSVPPSIIPYRYKRNKAMLLLGGLLAFLLLPLVFFQVYRSWKSASEKLQQGPLIETYN